MALPPEARRPKRKVVRSAPRRESLPVRGIAKPKPAPRLPKAVRPVVVAPTIRRPAPKRVVRKARPSLPPPRRAPTPAPQMRRPEPERPAPRRNVSRTPSRVKPAAPTGLYLTPAAQRLPEAEKIRRYGPKVKGPSERSAQQVEKLAPVLKVLEQTTRPLHGVAGGTLAAVEGRNVPKAVVRGLQNKDKVTFSKVLKKVGAPKAVQTVAGYGLDVALDPTTYLTLGAGSVAAKAAAKAGERATRKALKAGLTKEQAQRFGERAARQVVKKPEGPRGLTVKLAGREAPGVRRATAATTGRLTRKVGQTRAGQKLREVGAELNPAIASVGVSRAQHEAATMASRSTRGVQATRLRETENRAVAIRKALGDDDNRVVDAIEQGHRAVMALPKELQVPAQELRRQYGLIRKLEKRAGIRGGTRKNYVPHLTTKELEEKGVRTGGAAVGKRVIRPASSRARTREGTLAEKRERFPGEYNEDAALAYLSRMAEGHRAVSQADLNRRIADELGRDVKPGRETALTKDEGVFQLKGSDLTEIRDPKVLSAIADGRRSGRFVVLNRNVVKRAHATTQPSVRTTTGRILDVGTGKWKYIATVPNPAFHLRNLIGDLQNAYLGQPAYRLPANLAHSRRVLKAAGREEAAQRTLGKVAKPLRRTELKIDGKPMGYADLAKEAADVGAIKAGFSREIRDQLEQGKLKAIPKTKTGQAARVVRKRGQRFIQGREDLARLATYIHARQRGMNPEKAAAYSAEHHFDYANVTDLERTVLRRAAPFYTFTARNVPLQGKKLLTRPGKYAQYQKVREEAAAATGLEPGYEKEGLSEFQQRQAPIPIKVGGKTYLVGVGGLPLLDIGLTPGAQGDPIRTLDEYMQRATSMGHPLIKNPLELFANYSAFFREDIRKKESPLVNAPSFVAAYPAWAKKAFHVQQEKDRRTGKKVWKWDAKVDYVHRGAVPGLGAGLMGLTAGPNRQGAGLPEKAIGFTGVKPVPYEPLTAQINRAYERLEKIDLERGYLRTRGENRADDAKRDKLNAEARDINRRIYDLSRKRGDKVLPTVGAPPKGRRRGPRFGGGGFDGGFGGGFGGGF